MKTLLLIILLFLAPVAAWAEKVALVIGNSDYEYVGRLTNPENDAEDVAAALKRIGFAVTLGIDLDYRQMRLAVRDFAQEARSADVVFVYYAGHGIEIDNTNFLIPVNAELKSDIDVRFEAIAFDDALDAISASKGLKIFLVDACRNNPFIAEMTRTASTRSIGRGLARVDPTGVLVGYSARGGTLALDGDGRNSPYAEALLSHIEQPGLELGKMFRKIRDAVYQATGGFQEPFVYGSLPGRNIYLVPAALQNTDDQTADATNAKERSAAADTLLKEAIGTENVGAKLSLLSTLARLYPETGAGTTARFLAQTLESKERPQQAEEPMESVTTSEPEAPERAAQNAEAALGLSRSDYTRLQRALNTLGYNVGSEDGIFGPRSRAGLTRYQRQNGQDGLGYLTASTVSALRAVPLPRKLEPDTNDTGNDGTEQTRIAAASAPSLSAAASAKPFTGNMYCRHDGRDIWDGEPPDERMDCLSIISATGKAVNYVNYTRHLNRLRKTTGTADAGRFVLPSNSNARYQFDGKTYVRTQPIWCTNQGKC